MPKKTKFKKLTAEFNALPDREEITQTHRASFSETERYLKDEIDISSVMGDGTRLAVLYGVLEYYLQYIERKVNAAPAVVVATDEDVTMKFEDGTTRRVFKTVRKEV
jgi:hypothetical protein